MNKMIAIVTGGTGGIGSAICQQLTTDYQVIACYFKNGNHEEAKHWQSKQKEAGYDIDTLYADITSFDECANLISLVLERYGQINVLVNNAGVTRDTSLKKMSTQQWQEVINANLTSVFNMTRHVLSPMLEKNYGRIISISSINGQKGQFGQCNYASTKAALFGFTKSLAQEVAAKGITVNTISPGYIKTTMLANMKDEILNQIVEHIPVGRLGTPHDIARAVAFLAAPEADFITGTDIKVNGGQYM